MKTLSEVSATGQALPAVTALVADYCAHLDADRLEAWCDLFADESSYRIVPRENRLQNLPAAILHLANSLRRQRRTRLSRALTPSPPGRSRRRRCTNGWRRRARRISSVDRPKSLEIS